MKLEQGVKLGAKGKYVLVQKIGKGGSAEVWRATDTILGRDVAIKLLDPLLTTTELLTEARRTAQLTFTGIVRVYEVQEHEGSVLLVEELIEGNTLQDFLLQHQRNGTWPSHDESLDILVRILESVRYAHSKDIIHRDLSPKNIMLTPLGDPKIIDFGLAKATHELRDSKDSLHARLTVAGTENWMAPEQIQGNPEFASDLFAVGLIGYLLFTRSHPFVDPTGLSRAGDRILSGHVIRQPRELSSAIPRHIDAALLKLLQHSPAERYRSAADAIIELEPPKARCEKCGAEISQKDNFCKQCGVKIDKKVEESAQPPTRVQADSAAADALSQRGYYKTRHGDLEGGIEDYRAAIQRDGQFARAYQNLGWALNRLGRFEEALDILNRAVELEPKNAIALKYRSYSHQQLDDYEASAEDLTLALKLSPEDTELLSLRAQCYARLRDYAKAQADLNQLLKLDPDNDRGLRLRERLVHLLPFNPIRGVSS